MTEDEMVGWHHRLDGREFEQALGVGDGQDSIVHGVTKRQTRLRDLTDEVKTTEDTIIIEDYCQYKIDQVAKKKKKNRQGYRELK